MGGEEREGGLHANVRLMGGAGEGHDGQRWRQWCLLGGLLGGGKMSSTPTPR